MKFKQHSGYITIDAQNGRALFYWLVESQNNPSTDPLVLWLNGGPGCSSFEGLLNENGPFWVNPDGRTLRVNPYSWNRVANVLYLESPAGVGFSYSNTSSDYTTGDRKTAQDKYTFLQNFFVQYPQFRKAPFWITGESYAGHYVPNLAQHIVEQNAAGRQPFINLVGFQVGNAWTHTPLDNEGAVSFWWSHSMISDEDHSGMMDNCDFANVGPLRAARNPALCNLHISKARQAMARIDIYNVYADVCYAAKAGSHDGPQTSGAQLVKLLREAYDDGELVSALAAAPAAVGAGDPCREHHLAAYLNQATVQKAIHARPTKWVGCSSTVRYSREDLMSSVLHVYHGLVKSGIRMLVFAGDFDGIVPVTGTRNWLRYGNFTAINAWRPWLTDDKQTGGFTQSYEGNLVFASVRGAGHMVPIDQPKRSFELFSRFLNNQPL